MSDFLRELDALSQNVASNSHNVPGRVAEECGTLGTRVTVALPNGGRLEGRADRLGAGGQLIVVDAQGTETSVSAGDVVHVR